MKILLDTCVSRGAVSGLKNAGYDVIWTGEWNGDPGDESILAMAFAEERILITLDKDFGELAILHKKPHHGILRIVNYSAKQQAQVCLTILAQHGVELFAGAIITAESHRIRIRQPDSEDDPGI